MTDRHVTPPPLRFLEPLVDHGYPVECWLVQRADDPEDAPPLVCGSLIGDDAYRWFADLAPFAGFAHPRLTRLHGVYALGDRALALADDDRGPTLGEAAAQLADPAEREAWSIAQIVGLADGLAALADHAAAPGAAPYVFRCLDADGVVFVAPGGHARLSVLAPMPSREMSRTRTGTGVVYGHVNHMSPEEAKGVPMVPESTVFSLAGQLANAIDGAWPFVPDGDHSPMETLIGILTRPPRPTRASPVIAEVLATALAKAPEERFAGPAAFAAALRACVPDCDEVDAVISDRIAAWLPTATPAPRDPVRFGPGCTTAWEAMAPTAVDTVRHCTACDQPVVQIRGLADLLPLTRGACVHRRS